jgi:hypothetical protein
MLGLSKDVLADIICVIGFTFLVAMFIGYALGFKDGIKYKYK